MHDFVVTEDHRRNVRLHPKPTPRLADRIELRGTASLVPYVRNPRTHSTGQVAQIAASIREFGFTNPVLVDEKGGIIAGHARVLAAVELGLDQVPTIELGYLSAAQRRAYVIADNQLALNAGWDMELLKLELDDLKLDGFDLSVTGFDEFDLAGLLDKPEGLTDPDDVPAVPEHPVSRTGDLWLLGRHRLLCGDSTAVTDVESALGGVKPHLMVTDPPYGVEYNTAWRKNIKQIGKKNSVGIVENDGRADWSRAWSLFPGQVAYVWHGGLYADISATTLRDSGFEIRSCIIWAKQTFAIGRGNYHWQHEGCWYVVRKGATSCWHGDRKQSTLWQISTRNGYFQSSDPAETPTGHLTQKPVECMRRPIENNSRPGQSVYEPFSGSGTTIIAAEITGRACHAIEIAPAYVDVAVKRWQDFTGKHATLERDSRTFDEVATQRSSENLASG